MQVSQSDEEEDLEALRLAALQSLKKNAAPPSQTPTSRGYANHRRFRQGHSYGQSGRFQSNRVVSGTHTFFSKSRKYIVYLGATL